MRKKRIFIYIHQCILKGGVEKVFFNLLNNLPKEQYKVTALSLVAYEENDLQANLYPSNVKRKWLYYDAFAPRGMHRLMQRLHNFLMPRVYPVWLRFCRFDTAIAAQEGDYARFVDEKVVAKKKVLWIHNDLTKCHWTQKQFESLEAERSCYARFDKIICVSEEVSKGMQTVFGPMSNLCVCYNPIDTNEIDEKKEAFIPNREKTPLFVAVGRLVHQKGFDRLLRICRRLNAHGLNFQVWILGEGEDRTALEEEIGKGGLENVKLLGNQNNPFPYMKAADWLICASRHEGFNMVLQEAAWCGTPAITTDNAGTKEFLGESLYGIVTENDENAVFSAMHRVLTEPELLPKYREAIKERKPFIALSERIERICQEL